MILSSNGQLRDQSTKDVAVPFFRLAFRPLFWLGAMFSTISIGLWSLTYSGYIDFTPFGGAFFWHAHEMLFGFTVSIIVGFLLTAVQTWTNVASIKGIPLALLVILWILARLLFIFPDWSNEIVPVVIDLFFLPLAALALSIPIIKAKLWRNLFFIPILLTMAVLNGLMHLALIGAIEMSYISIGHIMVLLVSLVMCIMGGRVFPMFTANGTGTQKVAPIPWLEKIAILSVACSIIITADLFSFSNFIEGIVYLIAGITNFIRAFRWRIWVTFSTPLVWPLHLSYWAICTGFILLSLTKFQLLLSASTAYHAITVGGIGFMVLSMISRVSLGHTGRLIQVGRLMSLSFILMLLAFVTRVFVPIIWPTYNYYILISGTFWVLAFAIFIFVYTPVLFKARIDGAKG